MGEPVIEVENVSKSYEKLTAVDNLSFTVPESVCFGFLGPNGAGKTTMMKMLYGKARRDNPRTSRISVFGYDPHENELEVKFVTGIVPQDDNLDPELTVVQNLLVYAKFYAIPKKTALERIDKWLDFLDLSEKRDAHNFELSGGMKRRLVIARALINNPQLLILDEPTTGLDPQVRHAIWDRLRSLKREGVTILLTTHYMEEAFQICDNIIIMHGGKRLLEGRPSELIRDNMEPYVLEIHNRDAAAGLKTADSIRREDTPNRLLLYCRNLGELETVSAGLTPGDFYLRRMCF